MIILPRSGDDHARRTASHRRRMHVHIAWSLVSDSLELINQPLAIRAYGGHSSHTLLLRNLPGLTTGHVVDMIVPIPAHVGDSRTIGKPSGGIQADLRDLAWIPAIGGHQPQA